MKKLRCIWALTAMIALVGEAEASCGSALCSVNTDWETQGTWAERGLRVDLRHEYIDQNTLRAGRREVASGEIPSHHDELRTINRNLLLTLDYSWNRTWGLSVQLPAMNRSHEHIHYHHGEQLLEQWQFSGLGDARVLGRYSFLHSREASAGVLLGAKLPTGRFHVRNADGDLAERTLQPGSGTTDVLAGAYLNRHIGRFNWFSQVLWAKPLGEREGFEPGQRLNLDTGLSLGLSDRLAGMLQVNAVLRGRDRGPEAEREDSGGEFVYLSPGVRMLLGDRVQAYALVQLPLYQRVNGVQLTSDWASVVGLSFRP